MKNIFSKTNLAIYLGIALIIIIPLLIINTLTPNNNDEDEIIVTEEANNNLTYDDYDWSNLSNYPYLKYDDDNYTSMFGIDVAAHQDVIDWKQVADAGVEFAYIRIGYRGAAEGYLNVDEQFNYNYENAKANGIKIGVYFYSQPVNELEASTEANFVANVLGGRELDLPIAYDFEETMFSNLVSRMHGMSKKDCTAMALAFCEQMEKCGYETILYTNSYWADNNYDWDILDDFSVWYAQYSDYPQFDRPFIMWQYSDNGDIPGINRNCDLDIMFIAKNG